MSQIECDNGHRSSGTMRDAAIHVSRYHDIGRCRRCDALLRYVFEHKSSNDPTQPVYRYELVRASRLSTKVDSEGYDPFLLVLKDLDSGKETVWPFFWRKDGRNKWRVGQWAPMLKADEWHTLFDRI